MTADQSPDLVTALRELLKPDEKAHMYGQVSHIRADDLRAILDAHPTPAQHDTTGHTLLEVVSESVTSGATEFGGVDGQGREFKVTVGPPITPAQSSEQEVER